MLWRSRRFFRSAGVPTVVHAFTDGRDTPPRSAGDDIARLTRGAAASCSDRHGLRPLLCDGPRPSLGARRTRPTGRSWRRRARAFPMRSASSRTPMPTISATSSCCRPWSATTAACATATACSASTSAPTGCARFLPPCSIRHLPAFPRRARPHFAAATGMTQYSEHLDRLLQTIFPPHALANVLGEVVAGAGRTQLRMAETEKYPHVTYFLNGGREEPYPGEDRILVPSPKVATYDLQPEMSAPELTDKAVEAIGSGKYDLIVLELRQSRHGRAHRQPAGRDQGGGGGGWRARPARRGDTEGRRRAAGDRRPRQLRADARSRDRRTAHRPTPPIRSRCC